MIYTFWEFIIENADWIVLITALVVLVGTVWSLISNKSTDTVVKGSKSEIMTKCAGLTTEHKGLSTEHDKLYNLLARIDGTSDYLKTEAIKADAIKQNMSKNDIDISHTVEQINVMISECARLREENARLQKENQSLHYEVEQLVARIEELSRDGGEWGLEL